MAGNGVSIARVGHVPVLFTSLSRKLTNKIDVEFKLFGSVHSKLRLGTELYV